MEAFVYKYEDSDSGLSFYWYNDDLEGDCFYSSLDMARIFSEREIRIMDLDKAISIGDEIFSPELNDWVVIKNNVKKINIKDV